MSKKFNPILAIVFLLLAACAPQAAGPTPAFSLPAPSLAPTQTALPTPTPAPTLTAVPTQTATPPGGGAGQIVFSSTRGGDYSDLYTMNSDGSHVVRLTQGEFEQLRRAVVAGWL